MNIQLFRPFSDPYRLSMTMFADQLRRRVGEYLRAGETIDAVSLPNARLEGWGRYWDQYVEYGRYAKTTAGDVNHIIDHGFGHLTSALPPGRTIVTFHDAVPLKVPGVRWTTRRSMWHSLRAMRKAAAILCDSQESRRDLLELIDYPEDRTYVMPLGIDEAFCPPPNRDELRRRLGLTGLTVLMAGHTQPYQNVESMLRALATVIARHGVDLSILKIGTAFTPEQMRLISELELSDHVSLVGRVPFADLPAYFQAADVLLYAPLLAGFGLPPLEAMACGTPVVASNRGSLPEVCGDAALLVDAQDEGAMAVAVAELLTDAPRRRRHIERGFEQAARFEWSRVARETLDIYRRTAGG